MVCKVSDKYHPGIFASGQASRALSVVVCVVAASALVTCLAGSPSVKARVTELPRKFLLEWQGADDLDLHLTGPALRAGATFHIGGPGSPASIPGCARLDPGGPGREAVTVPEPRAGIYQLYVHDLSACWSTTGNALSESAATVSVYTGSRLTSRYTVPGGQREGNLWTACWAFGEAVYPAGNMTFESDPRRIGTSVASALIPGDILLGSIDDSLVPGRWSHVGIYAGDGCIAEAANEDENVGIRSDIAWQYPDMSWVKYLRVVSADDGMRHRAVAFALAQAHAGCAYDKNLLSKQVDGGSWYCSELVWASYMKASGGAVDLQQSPDWFGVYPWEIETDDDVAVVGGHYEREPRRTAVVYYNALKLVLRETGGWLENQLSSRPHGFLPVSALFLVFFFCLGATMPKGYRAFKRRMRPPGHRT